MDGGGANEDGRLPPGFRFHPTDEELITYYLKHKNMESSFSARAIADADLNKCEPWDLPGKAKMGEKEWYFFSLRDRKYPTGVRTNRATDAGYWKTTGKDKEIFSSSGGGSSTELVGLKKTLVFYKGRAPRGEKSNWVMHEYRLRSKSAFKGNKPDDWVVCRVFKKSSCAAGKKYPSNSNQTRPNPYHLDTMAASIMPSMLSSNPSSFASGTRRLLTSGSAAELMELSNFAGSNYHGGPSIPILPHLNYPGGFTLSDLNLNLGALPAPALQPSFLQAITTNNQQQPNSVLPGCIMGIYGGFNADVNPTPSGSNMDSLNLEDYWPSY